jgi:hypothetical protein
MMETQERPPVIDLRERFHNVTSQHGENGVLDAIFARVGTTNKVCIEFGAFDLRKDSCIYPLWAFAGWHALLWEGNTIRAAAIQQDYARRPADEKTSGGDANCLHGFVRPSGPDSLDARLEALGESTEPDLLVIDIDGLDYYVWKRMERTRPRVVVCEFNPTIPPHLRMIGREDEGNVLGCSALSLYELARQKGYSLVCCTKVNGVFVRDDLNPEQHFDNVNDLETLFDGRALCYLMSAIDGGVFLSRLPFFDSDLLSDSPKRFLQSGHGFRLPGEVLTPSYTTTRGLSAFVRRLSPTAERKVRNALRRLRRSLGIHWFESSARPPGTQSQ